MTFSFCLYSYKYNWVGGGVEIALKCIVQCFNEGATSCLMQFSLQRFSALKKKLDWKTL